MTFPDALRLSVGTLTIVPSGAVRELDRKTAGLAMLLAPFAVLPLAVVAAGAGWLGQLVGWPHPLSGLLVVAVLALGTRALHLDGLADTVDGLGSGWDRDKALAVMRRGDVGPMGVTTLVLVLAAQVAAVSTVADGWRGAATVAVLICCSRASLAIACRADLPAARPDGLGAAVAGSVPRWATGLTWGVVAVGLTLLSVWRGAPYWLGLLGALLTIAAVLLLVRRCVRRFGGVTGDVLGAAVETAFTVLVLLAALW